ncbi:MAG TPA: tetratricopeptide repeat protein [Sphingomicrobium sp.]|nr:tetratricopeptide repeat protein [Sphingomicrobium sp.]
MDKILRALGLVVGAGTLMSVSPAPDRTYSPQLLAMLDPSASMRSLCGGDSGNSMRSLLAASAAVVGQPGLPTVPLYDGLGKVHFEITTSNPLAQRYFDQGLAWAYGFNHAGAIASFREAQRLDPQCAMCFWGEAFAHGPNINAPMDPAVNARAVGLANYIFWLARKASPQERALAEALLKRYSSDPKADRALLDAAYADAMLDVARAYPGNDDIALLAAEAAMDTRPWDYWSVDKQPNPRIAEAVKLVETVYGRNPDHPQAAHLYIHLMENGPDPRRGEAAADKLASPLSPTSGHLVHMPAHIYLRLGRWKDSMRLNVAAARADENWIKATGDKGLVRYGYYPHNVHFIVSSAQMAGDAPTAMREARKLAGILDPTISAQIAWVQAVNAAPYFTAAQFATPGQILAMKAPDARLPYPTAMRHYARAVAYANMRNAAALERELASLRAIRDSGKLQPMIDQGVPAADLLSLAESVARGRLAFARGRYGDAARHFRAAIALEGKVPYMEPPYWYYPVQQSLGAALYRQGRYDEARNAFMAALAQSPNSGWALYGLAATERAQGRRLQAAAADAALAKAWMGNRGWLRMERL